MSTVRQILFPFDFSPPGFQVAPFVRALAKRYGASVTLLSVVPPVWQAPPPDMRTQIGDNPDDQRQTLQAHLDRALTAELAAVTVARVADSGDPALRIIAFAEAHDIDLIMMPTYGLGLFRRLLLGSVTSKVLHDAKCPVWTSAHMERQRGPLLARTVLCAVDGGDGTPALMRWAADFAAGVEAELTLLHVVGPLTDWPSLSSEQDLQERARASARGRVTTMQRMAGVEAPLRVSVGEVAPTIAEEARQGADLVIVGRGTISEPFGRLRTHVFGILRRSPCPVLSV